MYHDDVSPVYEIKLIVQIICTYNGLNKYKIS